jgi:predicted RNA-binding protein YlqC (UPF0109 family)
MEELVEFLAKSLVEDPDAVQVHRKETRYATILKLRVAPRTCGQCHSGLITFSRTE